MTENNKCYKEIDTLIIKFLSNEIDPLDLKRLTAYSKESHEYNEYIKQNIKLWISSYDSRMSNNPNLKFNSEVAYNRFLNRIDDYIKKLNNNGLHKINNKRSQHIKWADLLFRIAAVFILLIGLSILLYPLKKTLNNTINGTVHLDVPLGSISVITLPDNTKVWLNAGSSLNYSNDYGVNDRKVNISGEAYLEVASNPDKPFELSVYGVEVRVLGTKFNVKAYDEENQSIISLLEGEVLVTSSVSRKEIYLYDNQRVCVDKYSGDMKKEEGVGENAYKWIEGNLFFDHERLDVIAATLMRRYKVIIKVDDSIKNERFYGNLTSRGQELKDVLDKLVETGHVQYKYIDGTYYMHR